MKKILLSSFLLALSVFVNAQSSNYFKYQAVIRDNNGELIIDQNVSFRISILVDTVSFSEVYQENHTVTSDGYGVCNLEIGNGGNPSTSFDLIDWGSNQYFLKIEMDESGESNYRNMGTVQLLSVPYSLHSNSSNKAKIIDNPILYFTDTDTLFAVKDRAGN